MGHMESLAGIALHLFYPTSYISLCKSLNTLVSCFAIFLKDHRQVPGSSTGTQRPHTSSVLSCTPTVRTC